MKSKKLTDKQLKNLLKPIQEGLKNYSKQSREDLFDRYMGELYGDEVEGRSKFMSTDVSDVVESVFAEAMEALTNDETLVEFDPSSPEDEEASKQETDLVHSLFRDQNDSFAVISVWFKEGLIEQAAYVRSGWVDKTRVMIEEYEDLDMEQFMLVYSNIVEQPDDYEIEILEGVKLDKITQMPIPMIGKNGEPEPIHIRARIVRKSKLYEIEPIPQDEFFVSSNWTKPTLRGCPVYGHKARKSKSDLIALGFSKECVEELQEESQSSAAVNRHNTKNNDDAKVVSELPLLGVFEAYVLADIDGDDIDELVNVWTNYDGTKILKYKDGSEAYREVEKGPFSSWTPYIVPHRHVGRSVAELATSAQLLKTTLWRQMLDAVYRTNHPRPVVNDDKATSDTYIDLASPHPGAPVRVAGDGAIEWQKPTQLVGDMLPLFDRADTDLEKHAGATRYSQGVGGQVFNNSQVGSQGVAQIMDASMRRMQTIIRTFAETGLRDLFYNMHADLRRGPNRKLTRRIRGTWVTANPLEWRERSDMTVRIGTGKGDRQQKVTALERTLVEVKEGLANGLPLYNIQNLYEVEKRLMKAHGLPSSDPFISDPNSPQVVAAMKQAAENPPRDIAAEAALEMAKAEVLKAQAAMLKAQTDQAKSKEETALKQGQLELEVQIAAAKAREAEANLEIKRVELEIAEKEATNRAAEAQTKAQIAAIKVAADIDQADKALNATKEQSDGQ